MNSTLTSTDAGRTNFMQRLDREVSREMELAPSHRVSVLIVEDDPGCRELFTFLFKAPQLAARFTVEFAESVNQAMTLIAHRVFDICVLDYTLPDGSAADLVRMWREYGYEVPFICISGDTARDREMQELGALSFMLKSDAGAPDIWERTMRYALHNYWQRVMCQCSGKN